MPDTSVLFQLPDTRTTNQQALSWSSIAAAFRHHARSLPHEEARELLDFAELMESFEELEQRAKKAIGD
ncbi:MAG TPA: hypothetical protein VE968_10250 [Sphingomicrobium sp.]|nr:hypothetical protein [Sphingomicrobium sp.]